MPRAKGEAFKECAGDGCKLNCPQDDQYKALCRACAKRIRQIDAEASNTFFIRKEMTELGIPVKGRNY